MVSNESGGLSLGSAMKMATPTISENIQIRKKIEKFAEQMARRTRFSETEVEKLVLIYNKLTVNPY